MEASCPDSKRAVLSGVALRWLEAARSQHRCEHHYRRNNGRRDQHAFRLLSAEMRNDQNAEQYGPDDRTNGIRRVDAADESSRVLTRSHHGGDRERETRSPQKRRRKHRDQRSQQIDLKRDPRIGRQRRIDRPVWKRLRHHVRCPRDRRGQPKLAPAERALRAIGRARARPPRCFQIQDRSETPQG